jgi:hypothetical protein
MLALGLAVGVTGYGVYNGGPDWLEDAHEAFAWSLLAVVGAHDPRWALPWFPFAPAPTVPIANPPPAAGPPALASPSAPAAPPAVATPPVETPSPPHADAVTGAPRSCLSSGTYSRGLKEEGGSSRTFRR